MFNPKPGEDFPFAPGGPLSGRKGENQRDPRIGDTDLSDVIFHLPVIMTRQIGADDYETTAYFRDQFYIFEPTR